MLLLNRTERLRRLIVVPPGPLHAARAECGKIEQQRDVLSPWALAASSLVLVARADCPHLVIHNAFNPVVYRCACSECREMVQVRITEVVQEWNSEKVSRCLLPSADVCLTQFAENYLNMYSRLNSFKLFSYDSTN